MIRTKNSISKLGLICAIALFTASTSISAQKGKKQVIQHNGHAVIRIDAQPKRCAEHKIIIHNQRRIQHHPKGHPHHKAPHHKGHSQHKKTRVCAKKLNNHGHHHVR